jgi:hypothetical protein
METDDKLGTVLCGVAGEYFVAAEPPGAGTLLSHPAQHARHCCAGCEFERNESQQ